MPVLPVNISNFLVKDIPLILNLFLQNSRAVTTNHVLGLIVFSCTGNNIRPNHRTNPFWESRIEQIHFLPIFLRRLRNTTQSNRLLSLSFALNQYSLSFHSTASWVCLLLPQMLYGFVIRFIEFKFSWALSLSDSNYCSIYGCPSKCFTVNFKYL